MNKLTEWLTKPFLEEDINIPVNVGDTILVGKFKNKKMVIKDIGVDDHGMPTINGRKATTFRIHKKVNIFDKEEIKEGVNDPGIFKAVFLAGGPGSGKTFVSRQLFGIPDKLNISMSGMKMVNSDKELKFLLKKYGFGTDLDKMPDELFNQLTNPKDKDYSGLRDYSKSLTKQRMKQYREGRLGMIIDGTGHKWKNVKKEKIALEKLGYDTYMIYVNTTLEVAQQRNQERDRILPPDLLEKSWKDVQKNRGAFKSLFKSNFIEVENSETLSDKAIEKKFGSLTRKYINVFMKRPIKNKIAKNWIKKQQILKKKGIKEIEVPSPSRENVKKNKTDRMSGYTEIKEFINKPKMKKALQQLVDKNLIPKVYVKNMKKLQTFLVNNPMVMTQLLRLLGEEVNEAFAVRGNKVEKFITGKNLTHKGKKYKEIEFETIKVDNPNKKVTLRILSPKKLFGQEVPVRFQTLRRGPFLKTDTGKKLKEQKEIKKVVGIYGGRFQPFGPHHKKTYEWLKKQVDEAYIVTSNLKSLPRHPMNFREKVRHMVKMGIPKNKIIQERTPYKAINTLKKFDEDTTAVIYIFGEKDANRLKSGAYFDDYNKNKNNMVGYRDRGYILTAPHQSIRVGGQEVSGTVMRQLLGSPDYEKNREKLFKKAFGYFDKGIFTMMNNKFKKLFESIDDFLTNNDINKIIKEGSVTVGSPVDDGPATFHKGFGDYRSNAGDWIESMYKDTGWELVQYILGKGALNPDYDYTLKYTIVPAVSYQNQGKYRNHIEDRVLKNLGYEVLKWMGIEDKGVDPKSPALPGADGETENTDLKERINLDKEVQLILEVDRMTLEEGVKFNNFLKDWAKKAKQPLSKIRKTMMNKNTFSIAKLNDFNVDKVLDGAKKGFQAYQKVLNYVPDKIAKKLAKTKFGQKKEKGLKKLDDYLQKHPKLKRVMGVAAAAGVTYAWTKMTFIGDPEYDLDLSAAATAAAAGEYSMADLFSGEMGTKFLVLTAVGATTGLTAPYTKILGSATTMAAGVGFGAYRAYKARKQRKADAEKKTKTSVPDTVKNPNPKGRKKTVSRKSAVQWVAKTKGPKAAKKYVSSLSEIVSLEEEVQLIIEGGAYGHMNHPFDDKNITFSDLKQIIINGLGGKLNREDGVTEKLDGQNLMISWVNGKLVTARNKSQLKNFGSSAMDIKGVASKFSGRGDIRDAFVFAMKDLNKSIGSLSDKQKEKIFGNGKRWMNLEVMYPKSANVIDYDKAQIVFHGTLEYNESGTAIGQPKDSARMLAGMIKQVNQHIQKHYKIGKPQFLTVPKVQDFGKKKKVYLNRLKKLQNQYRLKDNDTLSKYHQSFWEEFIFNSAKQMKYKIPNKVLINLTKRWAFFDKSYKIPMIKKDIDNKKFLDWVLSFDKNDHQKWVKDNMKPFEVLFFDVGAEILKNIGGYLAASPQKAVQKIRKDVINAIKTVKSGGDIKKIQTLKHQLDKLNKIGGLSAIVPSEGIVFKYKGKTYKFTGAFAPVNQIIGLLNF